MASRDKKPAVKADVVADMPPGVVRIETSSVPFIAGGHQVARIDINPITFKAWAGAITRANLLLRDGTSDGEHVANQRFELIRRQAVAYDGNGAKLDMSDLDIRTMPRPYAVKLLSAVGVPTGPDGEMISEGDGLDRPIIWRLGTPLKYGSKDGGGEVVELEFMARTMMEIAPVTCAPTAAEKALAFIAHCTREAGASVPLPSALADAITLRDGLGIMAEAMPRFLE